MPEVHIDEKALLNRLVVLDEAGITVANPDKEDLARIASAFRSSADASTNLVGSETVPFAAIKKVRANRHNRDLWIDHRKGLKTESTNISFKNTFVRDSVLETLAARLGPDLERKEVQYGVVRASVAPALSSLLFAIATWALAMAAEQVARGEELKIHGRHLLWKRIAVWVAGILGPTGVWIVGGLAVAALLGWLVARVRKPPLMVILRPRK